MWYNILLISYTNVKHFVAFNIHNTYHVPTDQILSHLSDDERALKG